MQEARIGRSETLVLDLDAGEKARVATEIEMARHGRAGAIRTQNVACRDIEPLEAEQAVDALGAFEAGAIEDLGAGTHGLARQPAQQIGRVGGEKEIAGREQIDVLVARRIEPNAVDAPRQRVRNIDLVRRFLHQDAGGGDAVACFRLGFEHGDTQAAHGGRSCGNKAGERGADDGKIIRASCFRHRCSPAR